MTAQIDSIPSTFERIVHFRPIFRFKDRLRSPLWSAHFEPDADLKLW